ncbi:hypothetical protein NIES4071_97050 [Calothrix sp. NIES-4071]|nr:hypothetical protein NIES4071_97050 [Calothrix sp. NIES-4071]BAZ63970.1 hypothetical protein NIES4105_96980 [Calothrix sp. NIES-4105]
MFTDIQNHWAQESILQLRALSLISGYPDGTFRPNAFLTRAEFAAILVKAFPNVQPIRGAIVFKDVSNRFWGYNVILQAYRTGFMSGYPDETFKPNMLIPRLQVFLALVSGLKYTPSQVSTTFLAKLYDDANEIPSYAVGAIVAATEKSLVVNYPNVKRLNPSQRITRGEVVAIICQALNIPGVSSSYIPLLPPQLAIDLLFDDADSFSFGRARVKIGDKWGYIDNTGKQVIPPQFNDANSFTDSQAQLALIKQLNLVPLPPISGAISETRGVWITITDSQVLSSRENIATAMEFLAQTGFNVVFPVVWSNGYTIYPSQTMREFGVEIHPRFVGRDPLGELIESAKRFGIAVIPWFEYGFACSYARNGGHIIAKKPQWAARNLSGNLLSKNNFEWMNALDTEVQDFLLSLVLEVVKKYNVQGIQGDDRMPALPSEGGYDALTVERYTKQFNQKPPENPKDAAWIQWRADILTNFLTRFYREIINVNPNLITSSSPSVFPWGLIEYLQDSQTWTDLGLVDLIHPQIYYRTFAQYKDVLDRLLSQQFTPAQQPLLAPGILLKVGSYRISPELLLQKIQYNRERGIKGEVLFFYEGLRENNDELAKALRKSVYAQSVPFNTASIKARGFTRERIGVSYSYIDISGKTVSQPQYDWVDSYSQGLARVRMGYKWGYINVSGQLVGKLQFDAAEPFVKSNLDPSAVALALVRIGNEYRYINTSGEAIIRGKYDVATSFQEGLAAVKILDKYGYINTSGAIVIQPQFEEANLFSEGLAAIKLNGRYGYIDTTGKVVIQPQFTQVKSFSQGLAAITNSDKWGYINVKGETVIPLQFAIAESFSQNLAAVKIGNLWGYINLTGKIAIRPTFDDAKPFREGLALIKQGAKWGYIKSSPELFI